MQLIVFLLMPLISFVASLIMFILAKFCKCFLSSLNWQHHLCKYPKENPEITTLLIDHTCPSPQQGFPMPTMLLPAADAAV